MLPKHLRHETSVITTLLLLLVEVLMMRESETKNYTCSLAVEL